MCHKVMRFGGESALLFDVNLNIFSFIPCTIIKGAFKNGYLLSC